MVHGGYVAGLLFERWLEEQPGAAGAVQVTLRKPTPFDQDLGFASSPGRLCLMDRQQVLVEAEASSLELELPQPPPLSQAREAQATSPSHYDGRGVHPVCFGCGSQREPGDALRIFVGPCEVAGRALVAAPWRPGAGFADGAAEVPPRYVLAALDCPGAFAYIARDKRAGLLGRIVFEQYRPVAAEEEYIVVGFQLGEQGRKLFAGTALFDADGQPYAAARATWFGKG